MTVTLGKNTSLLSESIYIYSYKKKVSDNKLIGGQQQESVPIGAQFPFLVIHLTFLSFSTLFLIEFAEDLFRRF